MRSLAVIMPAYNEEDCIRGAIHDVQKCILSGIPESVLVIVNDGSTDGTAKILDEMAFHCENLEVVHKPNGGHGEALLVGASHAHADYLLLLDADRQIRLEDFREHWTLRAPNRVVCGVRQGRNDARHRLVITRIARLLIGTLFGCYIEDANVPYKIVPQSFWQQATRAMPPDALTPSLFLSVLAAGCPSTELLEVPVQHLPRRTGGTTLVSWKLVRFCLRVTLQLAALRAGRRRP